MQFPETQGASEQFLGFAKVAAAGQRKAGKESGRKRLTRTVPVLDLKESGRPANVTQGNFALSAAHGAPQHSTAIGSDLPDVFS